MKITVKKLTKFARRASGGGGKSEEWVPEAAAEDGAESVASSSSAALNTEPNRLEPISEKQQRLVQRRATIGAPAKSSLKEIRRASSPAGPNPDPQSEVRERRHSLSPIHSPVHESTITFANQPTTSTHIEWPRYQRRRQSAAVIMRQSFSKFKTILIVSF